MHNTCGFRTERLKIVLLLMAFFVVGIYFFSQMMFNELPRMEWWHRVLIWNGDIAAIWFAFRWARIKDDESRGGSFASSRYAAVGLALSLLSDVGLTGLGIWTEYVGWQRKIPVEADVVKLKMVDWQTDVATYYEIEVEFADAQGRRHRGLVNFIRQKNKGFPSWVPMAIRQKVRQRQAPASYPIFYDPLHPKRVWSKGEPWLRANALSHMFLMIHMFQVIIAFLFIAKAFAPSTPQNEVTVGAMGFAPFATQVVVMVLFGFMFWVRGF